MGVALLDVSAIRRAVMQHHVKRKQQRLKRNAHGQP